MNEKITIAKKTLKSAVRLVFTQVALSVLAIIVYVFMTMFAVSAFAEKTGYEVYTETESGKYTYLYSHLYADGEDEKLANYDEDKIYKQGIRELSTTESVVSRVIIQIVTAAVYIFAIYAYMHKLGDADATKAEYNNKKYDKLFGFKAGIFALIPSFVIFLAMLTEKITEITFSLAAFKLSNFSFFYLIELATKGAIKAINLSSWSFLPLFAIMLILPVVAGISYIMGAKHIFVTQRIVYEKGKAE